VRIVRRTRVGRCDAVSLYATACRSIEHARCSACRRAVSPGRVLPGAPGRRRRYRGSRPPGRARPAPTSGTPRLRSASSGCWIVEKDGVIDARCKQGFHDFARTYGAAGLQRRQICAIGEVGQSRSRLSPLAWSVTNRHRGLQQMPRTPDHPRFEIHRVTVLRSSFVPRDGGDHLRISFAQCFDAHLGLRLRAEETQRCISRVFAGRLCVWCLTTLELQCAPEVSADFIEGKLADLAEALARIAWRPLTPRLVAAALGITGQERARGRKDGRLPHSDQVVDRRSGGRLPIPTYSVRLIEDLLAHPEVLAGWREEDATPGKRT
jgi:hypothetical protein